MTNPLRSIAASGGRRRWLALAVVCLAQLMIVLDTTIVNVALPQIQGQLHFSQATLTWVINAFLISFGSLLLLAGRLGDLFGRRRIFLAGVTLFTAASALCGLAGDGGVLIAARFAQGVGAALQASVILAIIVTEFPAAADRARAMSAYVFVSVAGGSLGLLAGGLLTQALSWHWIFFVNLPIGIVTVLLGRALIARDQQRPTAGRVDWLGSALVTSSLTAMIYAIVQATAHGWISAPVLAFASLALLLAIAFLAWEARVANPIMPLRILSVSGLLASSVVRGFLVTGMYSTFFLGTIYLERVRHYGALETGLAWLPWTLTVAATSLGVTTRLVARLGATRVMVGGMLSAVGGLALLTTIGAHTAFIPTIFFAFFLIGLGIGTAFMPLLTIAMANVPAADAGLGSGIVNVSQQVAGALGLAVLSTIATNRSHALVLAHHALPGALISGDRLAFSIGAASVGTGALLAVAMLGRRSRRRSEPLTASRGTIDGQGASEKELELELVG
jgi:EmrB/QacA subfamily drug resistance transporter